MKRKSNENGASLFDLRRWRRECLEKGRYTAVIRILHFVAFFFWLDIGGATAAQASSPSPRSLSQTDWTWSLLVSVCTSIDVTENV